MLCHFSSCKNNFCFSILLKSTFKRISILRKSQTTVPQGPMPICECFCMSTFLVFNNLSFLNLDMQNTNEHFPVIWGLDRVKRKILSNLNHNPRLTLTISSQLYLFLFLKTIFCVRKFLKLTFLETRLLYFLRFDGCCTIHELL